MTDKGDQIILRGYIEERDGWWQAICIDLDIAAQGKSLSEAKALLDDMIETYLESLADCTPEERKYLLNRKSPLRTRIGFFWRLIVVSLLANRRGRDTMGFISHRPCPA